MLHSTVWQMFLDSAARFPERPCAETAEAVQSYAAGLDSCERVAFQLLRGGVRKGTRVGIWCKDSPEFLILYLALEQLGAVPVLLNTALTGPEMAALLRKAGAETLFFYGDGFKSVSFPAEVEKLGLAGGRHLPGFLRSLPPLTEADRAELRRAAAEVRPEDPDVIIFTSGTTGIAKGVLTTHDSRVNVALVQAETLAMTEADKCCVAIPMYHCFGLTGVVLAALSCGACLYFPAERRTQLLLESVSRHGCTILSAVPAIYSAILARKDIREFDLHTLRTGYIGGSTYPQEFFRRTEAALGFRLAPSLGQTEATAGLTFISPQEPEELRVPTVGRFMAGIEGMIADVKTGRPLPPGETGEIRIRGWSVMLGYVDEPALTAETVDAEGWLHTGDLAWMDGNNCLHMAGRIKELSIRGCENVAPGEIEDVLARDPRIREVKCVGVPDDHYGEEVCACVVSAEGAEISEEEVRALAAKDLAPYKVPRYVIFPDSIPRNESGKPELKKLRKTAAEALHLKT